MIALAIGASLGAMFATSRLALLVVAGVLAWPAASALAQSAAQQERIAASFVLALGRTPTPAEAEAWAKQEPLSLALLVTRHRERLRADAAAERAVIVKAGQDAFGVPPGEDDVKKLSGAGTYTDLVQRHLAWLAGHPDDYEQVVQRAYRRTLQRDAYSVEIDYWRRQPSLSFALLAGCIEDWARRNRPGLMATTGVASVSVNSEYLETVRVSPAVATEARAAAGLTSPAETSPAAGARRVVAPGAGAVASVGGIHFVAAGAVGLGASVRQR